MEDERMYRERAASVFVAKLRALGRRSLSGDREYGERAMAHVKRTSALRKGIARKDWQA